MPTTTKTVSALIRSFSLAKLTPTTSKLAACFRQLRLNSTRNRPIMSLKYLTQAEAINLDKQLFDEYAFSVDQLMELAGLSVATAIATSYPKEKFAKPVICCGSGNNGGDGLVCARHLKMFGYLPSVVYPKQGRGKLFENLLTQCKKYDIPIETQIPETSDGSLCGDLVIDCVFGFSFKPPNRSLEFAKLLNMMHNTCAVGKEGKIPLVSVDIPSGWHVEDGYAKIEELQATAGREMRIPILQPDCLVSLTAPKLCAKFFSGNLHYLGGRFCPKELEDKYQLNLPEFPGHASIVELPKINKS